MTEHIKIKNKREWIRFLEWINYLSPWNFWMYHNDKRRGLKPDIEAKLKRLIDKSYKIKKAREEAKEYVLVAPPMSRFEKQEWKGIDNYGETTYYCRSY